MTTEIPCNCPDKPCGWVHRKKNSNIVVHIEPPKGDVDRFLLDLLQEWHNRGGGPDGMGVRA